MTQSQQPQSGQPFTSREFRDAMGQFASGVVVISARGADGAVHAMTANAFMSGSLEPPLIVVSIATTARMHEFIQTTEGFGISILHHHQEKVSNHFAGRPTPDHEPAFEDLADVPVIEGAGVRLATRRQHAYPCGDHTLFVGQVLAMSNRPAEDIKPLLFYCGRYGDLARADWSQLDAPETLWLEQGPSW